MLLSMLREGINNSRCLIYQSSCNNSNPEIISLRQYWHICVWKPNKNWDDFPLSLFCHLRKAYKNATDWFRINRPVLVCFGWRMERYLTTLIPPWMIMLKQPKKTAPKPYQLQPGQIINKLIQVFGVDFFIAPPGPYYLPKNLNIKDLKSMEGERVAGEVNFYNA